MTTVDKVMRRFFVEPAGISDILVEILF